MYTSLFVSTFVPIVTSARLFIKKIKANLQYRKFWACIYRVGYAGSNAQIGQKVLSEELFWLNSKIVHSSWFIVHSYFVLLQCKDKKKFIVHNS